ncbi:DUF6351 family protein [Tunturibacter empetritectus]|uniref:DUF6351 family protein n=1 Tax=Tunturiibacter empetritectus TaxID=3069691 RepID=A0AAU7ZIU4_9BACT
MAKTCCFAVASLFLSSTALFPAFAFGDPVVEISVLSSRPDMVSGGDALVQITGPKDAKEITVWDDNRNVTSVFHLNSRTQTLIGLVKGLSAGENHLNVKSGHNVIAHLTIVNHAIAGPVFSGLHQAPFVCETEKSGLGAPIDSDCSVKTKVMYLYKSTDPPVAGQEGRPAADAIPPGFKVYDSTAPRPSDLAEATTTEGKKVPYVVRWERGTINRAIYDISFLHEPGTPLPDPWTKTAGWNGRLVFHFAGGCGGGYHQGRTFDGVNPLFVSFGYADVVTSLNVLQNNCNDVISAETAEMVKEHFIKSYGVPVHTIGFGGSGGSIQQHLIAQDYPGVLDGIIPIASFPDAATILPGVVDCSLLAHFFDHSSHAWSDEKKTAVSGFATWGSCTNPNDSWIQQGFSPKLVGAAACNEALPADLVYDPVKHPKGARCDYYDNALNVFGTDPATHLARRALDNVGVQYGLAALNKGTISADEFFELNAGIGGFNADGNVVSQRTTADPGALHLAYSTGRVDTGHGGLGSIPIIDVRQYTDTQPDIHDEYRSFATRARLIAANGSAENQVIMTIPLALRPTANPSASFAGVGVTLVPKMDQWLDALSKDTSQRNLIDKIAAARPADITDACWSDEGEKIVEKRTYEGDGRCNRLYPPHGDPRIAAGEPLREDILKCTLKPIDPKDYVRPFTHGEMARLESIFPLGVCDYSVPGVGQSPLKGVWQKY